MTRDEAKEILAGRYIVNIDGEDEYCNKVNEALDMAISALKREEKWLDDFANNVPTEPSTTNRENVQNCGDLISRADAVKAVEEAITNHDSAIMRISDVPSVSAEPTTRERKEAKSTLLTLKHLFEDEEILKALDVAIECVSAEPTVIRSRTLMPTKDFKEWAKRVKEENPNVIVIPCDAEVATEPKRGEWIRKEKEENDCDGHRAYYWYECSECGAKPPKNSWKQECFSPYCPNCGAYMGVSE